MWVQTPLFTTLFGFIFMTIIMIGFIWYGDKAKSIYLKRKLKTRLVKGLIGASFIYYSAMLFDSFVKVVFFGILGYNTIWFQAMNLILGFTLALVLIFAAVFVAPTWNRLLSFLCILIYALHLFNVTYNLEFPGEKEMYIQPMLRSVGIFILVNILTLPLRKKRYDLKLDLEDRGQFKKLWDISKPFQKIVNVKTMTVLWVLFAIEAILELEGLSILYWVGLL